MSPSSRIQQSFVIFVLVIHLFWIANHLRWVANDQINPWKLGGYGMYTVPSPQVRVEINKVSPSGAIRALDPDSYSLADFQRSFSSTNLDRIFRCASVEPESVRAFFDGNPQLRGTDLIIIFTERVFSRDQVTVKRREQGRVQIQWIDYRNLVYGSQFCENVETGEVSWL